MEELLRHLLEGASGTPAYLIIFGVLVLCGLGLPLPEDLSLIFGGYLAYNGAVRLPVMIAVGFVGILCGDSLIYLAGRRVGDRVAGGQGFFARVPRQRSEGLSPDAQAANPTIRLARSRATMALT